ncbi:DUF4247 domain-containing protein [Pseudalkalibacillus caeni]|uniref:DUF4247 domain-containing protein n=1 Tax=Exobacillus caeni TaxID=2574798 RepID=A0A5R9FA44_9BACL|nr:DUF4247 domain-containing protein [Pseudalkalibacillus caeni]TLS39120.1 DUF4247 domain-containing protein [Pseudalkalibacillus caeni]
MKGQRLGIALLVAFVLLLAGCGITQDIREIIADRYTLEDTVKSSVDSNDAARIYAAEGKTIDDVSTYLQEQIKPNNASEKKDGKQILVYDETFVTLTEDEENPDDTLIEVASTGFVRDNYQPGFFNGFIAYYILDEILDVDDWGKRQKQRCLQSGGNCYKGYNSSRGAYKGPSVPPSFRGSGSRGGGPGTGK